MRIITNFYLKLRQRKRLPDAVVGSRSVNIANGKIACVFCVVKEQKLAYGTSFASFFEGE